MLVYLRVITLYLFWGLVIKNLDSYDSFAGCLIKLGYPVVVPRGNSRLCIGNIPIVNQPTANPNSKDSPHPRFFSYQFELRANKRWQTAKCQQKLNVWTKWSVFHSFIELPFCWCLPMPWWHIMTWNSRQVVPLNANGERCGRMSLFHSLRQSEWWKNRRSLLEWTSHSNYELLGYLANFSQMRRFFVFL